MRKFLPILAVFVFTAFGCDGHWPHLGGAAKPHLTAKHALDFKMKDIDDEEVDLSTFKGKVVLLVNVASACGYTPQYKELQELHERYGNDGLVVIGVPANGFGDGEPGDNKQIKNFCSSKFAVKFRMLSKVSVAGPDASPLYQYLTSEKTNPKFSGAIKWNFTKFVISRDGKVAARFESTVKPTAKEVIETIEAELKKPAA